MVSKAKALTVESEKRGPQEDTCELDRELPVQSGAGRLNVQELHLQPKNELRVSDRAAQ